MMPYLQLYNRVSEDGVELRGVFELKSSEPKPFPFTGILMHVNLTVAEDNRLEMSSEELSAVENDVAKLLHPVPRGQNVRSTGNSARTQFSSAGLRRSSRTRTAVFFNSLFSSGSFQTPPKNLYLKCIWNKIFGALFCSLLYLENENNTLCNWRNSKD